MLLFAVLTAIQSVLSVSKNENMRQFLLNRCDTPRILVDIIKDGVLVEKRELKLPEKITNVLHCKNPRCITSIEQELFLHIHHIVPV